MYNTWKSLQEWTLHNPPKKHVSKLHKSTIHKTTFQHIILISLLQFKPLIPCLTRHGHGEQEVSSLLVVALHTLDNCYLASLVQSVLQKLSLLHLSSSLFFSTALVIPTASLHFGHSSTVHMFLWCAVLKIGHRSPWSPWPNFSLHLFHNSTSLLTHIHDPHHPQILQRAVCSLCVPECVTSPLSLMSDILVSFPCDLWSAIILWTSQPLLQPARCHHLLVSFIYSLSYYQCPY